MRYLIWLSIMAGSAGLAVGGAWAAGDPTALPGKESEVITSWNRCSRRFIEAPVFEVKPAGAQARYRALVRQGERRAQVESDGPMLDLKPIWPEIEVGPFELKLQAVTKPTQPETLYEGVRVKAAPWAGFSGKREDWVATADRNIAWLIDVAENGIAPYREPGVPVWLLSAQGPKPDGPEGDSTAYPALHMPFFMKAFILHGDASRPQAKEAMRLAELCGDWSLKNRNPQSGALPLFPFSTITKGKFEGDNQGKGVNLLRASNLGVGLVELYRATRREPFLDYAVHIADTTIKFQQADGSFPYRIDPENGQVVELYTGHASEFATLVDAIEPYRSSAKRREAAVRAVNWMLAVPYRKHHWQAGFEDVGETAPYSNLENWAAQDLIRWLCRHAKEDPTYLPIARELNRWVEDQFVVFGADASIPVQPPTPMVLEQYICYWPMECHTGNWIRSLIELHRATGEQAYLDKAMAAGNAISASQFPDGQLSTWGIDQRTGKPVSDNSNWYGCNAMADEALYLLAAYVKGQK